MTIDRRTFLASTSAVGAGLATPAFAAPRAGKSFPKGSLWGGGAATAGHQVEGSNVNTDVLVLEHAKPTVFAEPSGYADNSFALWREDLDLLKRLGLNTYRFSLE